MDETCTRNTSFRTGQGPSASHTQKLPATVRVPERSIPFRWPFASRITGVCLSPLRGFLCAILPAISAILLLWSPFVASPATAAAEVTVTAAISPSLSSAVDLREGPGSFYPMVARLQPSASITLEQESDGWARVQSGSLSGWIPTLALSGRQRGSGPDSEDAFGSMRDRFNRAFDEDTVPEEAHVSEAQVVAAVKGFIENHIAASGENWQDYSDYFAYRYNVNAYLRFRESRISERDWQRAKRSNRIRLSDIPRPSHDLDPVGWAAGNRIAQIGIYEDPSLQQYLNHISMLVAESSHRPDLSVNVIILDTEDIVGYAVPGGLIFVSLGTLGVMRTEAEFASFVGHEIAHLAFQHGSQELEKRDVRIRSGDAARRMDQFIAEAGMGDERFAEVTRELQETADDLFEYLVSDRLHDYEEEADYFGMIYANRAGYRGATLYNVLERISLFHREPQHPIRSAWFGDTMIMRLENLRGRITASDLSEGNQHSETWDARTRHLRTGR